MNGRVYDPVIGRMMSVDPLFQDPRNTQSVNPYTYVFNNPLSMVDPTGYCGTDTSTDQCQTSGTNDATNRVYKGHNDTGTMDHLGGTKLAAFAKALGNLVSAIGSGMKDLVKQYGPGSFIPSWSGGQAVLLHGNGDSNATDATGTSAASLLSGNSSSARSNATGKVLSKGDDSMGGDDPKTYGTNTMIAAYANGSPITDDYENAPMAAPAAANTALAIRFGQDISVLPSDFRNEFMAQAFMPHGFLEFQHNVLDRSDPKWYGQYRGYGNFIYGAVARAAGYSHAEIDRDGAAGVFAAHAWDAFKTQQAWRLKPSVENYTEWHQGANDYDAGKLNYYPEPPGN